MHLLLIYYCYVYIRLLNKVGSIKVVIFCLYATNLVDSRLRLDSLLSSPWQHYTRISQQRLNASELLNFKVTTQHCWTSALVAKLFSKLCMPILLLNLSLRGGLNLYK